MRSAFLTALAAAGLLATAFPAVTRAQASGLPAALDQETRAHVARVIETTRGRGLPVAPLVNIASLGAIRRLSGPSVVAGVTAMAEHLVTAHDALAPDPWPQEIETGAEAVKQGVPADALRMVKQVSPDRPVVVALGVLTQLVVNGVPVEKAAHIVTELVKRRAEMSQIVAFGDQVQADIARGWEPVQALTLRMQGLIAVLPGTPGDVFGSTRDLTIEAADGFKGATGGTPTKPERRRP